MVREPGTTPSHRTGSLRLIARNATKISLLMKLKSASERVAGASSTRITSMASICCSRSTNRCVNSPSPFHPDESTFTVRAPCDMEPSIISRMLPSSTVENYLKAIYQGQGALPRGDRLVPMGQVASALGGTPGTATTMVKALAEAGLAEYEPYSGVRLTRA